MSPLRIATITYDWYPFDIRVRRLAEAAVDGGFSMDVLCLRQPHESAHEVCNGVSIYRLPMDRGFGGSLPRTLLGWFSFLLRAGMTVSRLHVQHRYDVIHVHNMPDFLVFAALIPRLRGAKVILDIQDVSPELMAAKAQGKTRALLKRLAIWQERLSIAFADHVVTVGWPFEELLRRRGTPRDKLTIILNSADPKLFPVARQGPPPSSLPGSDQPFILMYHGTLAGRNGVDTAIRALALALPAAPRLRLDIMGRGEQVPLLKQLALELGVADRVTFADACPSDKIVDFVVHGDVGIIPYRLDGFAQLVLPTKAYEYAWMRRPIIASDTPAIRSMFRPDSLMLCDPAQPESFAAAIVDLYQHPEKRERMVESAAADYVPYQWEAMRALYCQLLRTLASQQEGKTVPASVPAHDTAHLP